MQGFARILLGSAAAVALASGVTVLSTTEASAQFPIPGLFNPMMHGFPQGHATRRGRVHETKHERHSKEAKDEDENDKKDKHSEQASEGSHSNQAEDKGPTQSSPPANANPPKQPVAADVPSLTPER